MAVFISAGSSIQQAVNANPAGTTFSLGSGTWHQQYIVPQNGDSFIGAADGSTVLSGDNVTNVLAVGGISGTGVLLQNVTVENYVPGQQTGAVHGVIGWTLANDTFQFNYGDGIVLGHDSTVSGGHYNDNAFAGISAASAYNIVVQGAEVAYNNTSHSNINFDAGGIKMTATSNVQILSNYVHDNDGHGIWADIDSTNWVIDHNYVTNNTGNGIQWEISDRVTISNNYTAGNNFEILISSAGDADVHNNWVNVPNGGIGILWVTQNRGDQLIGQNIDVHDNTIAFDGAGTDGWYNYGGSVGGGNAFYNNHYYDTDGDSAHFVWNNPVPVDWYTYITSGEDVSGTLSLANGYLLY